MKSIKNRPVIVLGLGPSGLFITRQIHKLTDKIYAIGRTDDVGMYSKYINNTHKYYVSTFDALKSAIVDISLKTEEKPLLIIASDQYLTQLLSEDVNWSEYVDIFGSDIQTLRLINNKQAIVEFCESNNLFTPQSYTFSEFKCLKVPIFPIIVKPNEKQLTLTKNPIGKIRICQNIGEFNLLLVEMATYRMDEKDFQIQNYIEGDNAQQYSVGGCYVKGQPLAEVVVNQIKQYPQGISAEVITSDDDNAKLVREIARKLVENLSFSGFLEVEFKIDKKSNKAYILDVNPRPWGWISVLGCAFDDFYIVFENKKVRTPGYPVIWRSKIRRFLSFRNANNSTREINKISYLKAYDIFDTNDRNPSLMIYIIALKKMFKK